MRRRLIVNADDFGLTDGVNRGIVRAHVEGIVTSASLMVRAPAAEAAVALALELPGLGLGLHFDLAEWTRRDDEWFILYQWADPDDADAVATELQAQLDRFMAMVGRAPDHIDSHQHVHLSNPGARAAVSEVARRLDVGVRSLHPLVEYRGLYGQDRDGSLLAQLITPTGFMTAIRTLQAAVTEIACHPGYRAGLVSDYAAEREIELESVCDPRLKATVEAEGVELVTWSAVGFDSLRYPLATAAGA